MALLLDPGAVQTVMRNLEAQAQRYERLATLAERQFDGLRGGRSEDLAVLLEAQEREILTLQRLERQRMEALAPLAAALARRPEEVRLMELRPLLPADTAAGLDALRLRLTEQAQRLRALHERNRRLLHSAQGIIRRWRSFLGAGRPGSATYSRTGARTLLDGARTLDQAA